MRQMSALAVLSAVCLLLSSCAGESAPSGASSDGAAESSTDFDSVKTAPSAESSAATDMAGDDAGSAENDAGIEIVPGAKTDEPPPIRKSIVGRWEVRLSNFIEDILGLLVEVKQTGDDYEVAIIDDSPMMPEWTIAASELTETIANVQFKNHNGDTVDFQGTLQPDGVIRGNVSFGTEGQDLMLWVATDRDSLADADQKVAPQQIETLQGFQPDPANAQAQLRAKANELIPTTLAYHLYRSLAGRARQRAVPEAEFDGFPEEYLAAAEAWGPRIVAAATLDIAYTAAVAGYSPELTQQYLKAAEEKLGAEATPSQTDRLEMTRALVRLHSQDPAEQQSGVEQLSEMLNDNPFDVSLTPQLAAYYDRSGQPEKAVELYATLAALPGGAGDMGPVMKLWKELGRDPKTIDDYLAEVYKKSIHKFADAQSDAPRAEGSQRVVLGELFTGGSCPPCVSADVATGGLERTYPESDFIMLRYHQHVPGPDPLAVPDGQQRAMQYYRIPGTPTLLVNGRMVPESITSIYGPLSNAPAGYDDLRDLIDPLLAESTDIRIALQATAEDEAINITAEVTGPEELPDTWRLRICLAEDEIIHPANNGIRVHEMVVQAMPGGAEGIAPSDGTLRFEDSVSLQDVRESIRAYLLRTPGLSAPPLEMTHLHVVAFVQDDADRSILQAATVPVTIDSAAPDAEATSKAPDDGDS